MTSYCEHLTQCAFFQHTMANMPLITEILKDQYCLRDNTGCARFAMFRCGCDVPDDLFPEDHNRAQMLMPS